MYRILFLVCISLGALNAAAQTQFGQYLGILQHSQIDQDQLAKLDFIVDRQSSTSYHFNSVSYNILSGKLVFDQPDQDVTFTVENFGSGKLSGKLRSTSAGDVGVVSLAMDGAAVPERALVQPLWGEYRGTCDDVKTVLQIQTHRSAGDNSRMGNPFGTFDVSAQLAEVSPGGCFESTLCVAQVYDTSSYNFFAGKLELIGRSRNLQCNTIDGGLKCGECTLMRVTSEAANVEPHSYPAVAGGFDVRGAGGSEAAAVDPNANLGGNYSGYLYHERLGTYQPVSLNVVTYQRTNAQGTAALVVSAVASMYFGGFDSSEYVTHRFNEKEFPLLAPQIVLERVDGDADTIIQLTQLGNGLARGIWYSLLYGRVGTFEMSNVERPKLPNDAKLIPRLSGQYNAGPWFLDLRVVRDSTPINTVNPFFPLNFKGAFRLQDITPNIRIVDGAYDFYTGKLHFRLEGDTFFSGHRSDGTTLMLKRPTPGIVRPLLPAAKMEFVREGI